VGFDLYVRLVGEAVAEYRGEPPASDEPDLRIDLPVEAYLPHDYVPSERLRLEVYKALSATASDADVDAVREELADRYGEPPPPAENLLALARFRAFARGAGLREVTVAGPHVRFGPVELKAWQQARLTRLYPRASVKTATSTLVAPRPATPPGMGTSPLGGEPLRDLPLLLWARTLVHDVLLDDPARAAG
jgi:transcription-repair coupling factor (superfamily II helicase)